jgi:hypothetical protein
LNAGVVFASDWKDDIMKLVIAAAALLIGATFAGATREANASPGDQGQICVAKVLHSEETPFAPPERWRVKVTLEITAPGGQAFETTLQDTVPWQAPPPRQGQTFRLRCDPANPSDLHFTH